MGDGNQALFESRISFNLEGWLELENGLELEIGWIRKWNSKNEIRKMKFGFYSEKTEEKIKQLQNSSEFIVAKQQIKIGWEDNELFQY